VSTQAAVVAPRRDLAGRLSASWNVGAVAAVLGLAAFLDLFRLNQNGYANTYYSAAVRSMLRSSHNFFFVSFDPGGLVSVDKPPLALWLEATSAKVFGYSSFAILLPEALAGVAAVWILYLLVARYFGRVAGLVAALALAVSPVSVSVNRDNNPDALLALLLVAAAYVGARAIESGRLRTLLLTAVLVGLAFNTKMLAAMVVVPGLALGYVLLAPGSWRRRVAYLAAAGAVLVVVSGAWIAAVDLSPASQRPYVGSTSDNSALSLALDYNGLGRVTGQTGGTSRGGGLGGAFSGTPGWLRLINDALGDQGGWLLPLALVGAASIALGVLASRRRRELGALTVLGGWFVSAAAVFSFSSGIIHTYYLSALAPATSALVGIGAVSLWRDARRGGWRLALPLAAIALGACLEIALLRRSGYLPWLQALVIVGSVVAAAGAVGATLVRSWPERRRALVAGGAIAVMLGTLLAAPAAWSATTLAAAVNGVFPGAGPDFVSGLGASQRAGFGFGGGAAVGRGFAPGGPSIRGVGPGANGVRPPAGGLGAPPSGTRFGGARTGRFAAAGGFGGADSADVTAALRYAEAHEPGSRFALIVQSEMQAAGLVIRGEPVASMGGFTGRETVLTNAYLARLVRSGDARYFLLGGARGGPGGTSNAAVDTISSTCTQVTALQTSASGVGNGTLYDCRGKADAIAAASS
jgi:4-amino-4-deoxy-L-arabinose transferase-like glycosyltransferase